jgi:PAS domain S-box-containing protein
MPIELADVQALLHSILTGTYEQRSEEEFTDPPSRELISTLNAIHEQKDSLLRTYNEDLRNSETRLRGIIESTPVGICITNEDGYYEYVNPTYCRLYGYAPDELIGGHFTKVVPEEHREELIHLHSEFMGRRYELRGEWSVVRKDGSPMSIIADAAYIIDVDGRPKKVTFVLDISERKRAEELLKQTVDKLNAEIEQRVQLEKTKNEVERMIRHDLRNPLNGIIAAAEILMTDEISEEQRELCLIIRESGRKLNSMLSSSMDLIRMEAGTYQLSLQPVNLTAVFQEVRRELEPLANSLRVSMEFTVSGSPIDWKSPLPLEGEKLYLAELFANLIRNAVEASAAGDIVSVRTDISERCVVSIHNSGAVPEDIREVFFERYATSGKKTGTGLGTYVAALITRVHRGEISYSTSLEDGTTVVVDLPAKLSTTAPGAEGS